MPDGDQGGQQPAGQRQPGPACGEPGGGRRGQRLMPVAQVQAGEYEGGQAHRRPPARGGALEQAEQERGKHRAGGRTDVGFGQRAVAAFAVPVGQDRLGAGEQGSAGEAEHHGAEHGDVRRYGWRRTARRRRWHRPPSTTAARRAAAGARTRRRSARPGPRRPPTAPSRRRAGYRRSAVRPAAAPARARTRTARRRSRPARRSSAASADPGGRPRHGNRPLHASGVMVASRGAPVPPGWRRPGTARPGSAGRRVVWSAHAGPRLVYRYTITA